MPAPGTVHIERTDGLVRIVLDRPPVNVLDIPMLHALDGAISSLEDDGTARVVLLTGAGRAFCAGVDVADHTGSRVDEMLDAFHGVIGRMLRLEVPLIAAVNGAALGGGCELVLACDLVLAAETAKLGQPEIRLGVFPPAAAALLPALVGPQVAADLVLSGRTFSGEEAARLGLVARVVPAPDLERAALRYAENIMQLSPAVVRLAKRALAVGRSFPPLPALDRTDALYRGPLMQLHDAHEGIAAFLEKREPVWKGA